MFYDFNVDFFFDAEFTYAHTSNGRKTTNFFSPFPGVTFPLWKRLRVRATSLWGSVISSILPLGAIPRVCGQKQALIQDFDCEYSFE